MVINLLTELLSWLKGALPWLVPSFAGMWAVYTWIKERKRTRELKIFEHALNHRIHMYNSLKLFLENNLSQGQKRSINQTANLDLIYVDFLLYANENEFKEYQKAYRAWKEFVAKLKVFDARQKQEKPDKTMSAQISNTENIDEKFLKMNRAMGEIIKIAEELDSIMEDIMVLLRNNLRRELNLSDFEVGKLSLPKLADDFREKNLMGRNKRSCCDRQDSKVRSFLG